MNFDAKIMMRLTFCLLEMPFLSTDQAARLFSHLKWPQKEASKYLKELERLKWVEGYDRRIGESKVWRVTLKAKKEFGVEKRAIPFTVRNMAHHLALADCYFDLREMDGNWIKGELREEFVSLMGKERKYCPDAFFIYKEQPYFLELQRSYLSRMNWMEKWKIANEFFGEGHFASCSVSKHLTKQEIPILVVTDQKVDVVETGADVPLIVVKNFTALKLVKEKEWS